MPALPAGVANGRTITVKGDANSISEFMEYWENLVLHESVEGEPQTEEELGAANHAPDEIIVKYKKPVVDTLKKQLSEKKAATAIILSPSLDNVSRKYKLRGIKPVVKNFKAKRERIETLLKKDRTEKGKSSLTERT